MPVYRHACGHVHTYVCGHVHGHVHRHVVGCVQHGCGQMHSIGCGQHVEQFSRHAAYTQYTRSIHATYMQYTHKHTCSSAASCVLHVRCMCAASILHVCSATCCTYTAYALHACTFMHLHARFMRAACVLPTCYVWIACALPCVQCMPRICRMYMCAAWTIVWCVRLPPP